MATALQEASDLVEFCPPDRVRTALLGMGLADDFVAALEQRLDAAREAQSMWVSVRDKTKSTILVGLEARATELRSELIAAGLRPAMFRE